MWCSDFGGIDGCVHHTCSANCGMIICHIVLVILYRRWWFERVVSCTYDFLEGQDSERNKSN